MQRGKMNLPPISISWLRHCGSLNLNRTKSFLFDLKCTKMAGGWGSAPDPAGGAHHVLHTAGEDGDEGKDQFDSILISWLHHCGGFKLHQSFLFDLKCPKIVGGWGSPQTPLGELTALSQILWLGWAEGMKFVSLLSCLGFLALPQTSLEGNNTISFYKKLSIFEWSNSFQKIVIYIAPNASFLV